MKVLIVSNLYPPDIRGGYEILCHQFVGELMARGHEATVLTSGSKPLLEENETAFKGKHGEIVWPALRLIKPFGTTLRRARLSHTRTAWRNAKITRRLIKKSSPDIIFFWSMRRLSLGPIRAAAKAGLPYAITLNDDFLHYYRPAPPSLAPRKAVSALLDRTLFWKNTFKGLPFPALTAISHALVKQMVASGAPVDHARIIYQGIYEDAFPLKENPGSLSNPPRILYAGQVHEYKGVHTIINALAKLPKNYSSCTLTIIGDGDKAYRERLETEIARLGIQDRVLFKPKQPQDELAKQYREHDVFIFSSIWSEPFGLTHLEAMASGTPVISTTNGGPAEFLEDRVNALVFPSDNPIALAECIQKLFEDRELRIKMAGNARKMIEQRFTFDRYASDLIEFLNETRENWPQ